MTRTHAALAIALVLGACGDGRGAAPRVTPAPAGGGIDAPGGAVREPDGPADARLVAPPLRLAGPFAVTGYTVTLAIDPAQPDFAGDMTIAGTLAQPQAVVWLHAEDLAIESAIATTAAGEVALEAITGVAPGRLALRAPAPLPAGPLSIAIRYRGKLDAVDTAGTFRQQYGGDWYAFTQHEALYGRRSFPCIDEPGVKVPWSLTMVVPAGLVAVANAPIERETVEGDRRTVRFATTPPLPSYLIAYAVGPFEFVSAGTSSGGAPMRIVTLKGRTADAAFAASATPRLLAALEAWFGTPYPYAKLDQIAIPTTVGFGAMENPGLITYRETLLLLPKSASEARRRRLTGTMTHELAHLWFGDLVTPAWWDDIWLNESFASWLPGKIVGEVFPAWDKPEELVEATGDALRNDSLATARRIRQPIETEDDIVTAFDGITYGKGAAVLRMFEQHVGEEAFQRGVRAYLAKHAHGNATAADFVAAIDAAAPGKDVVASFGTFLDQAGAPRVGVAMDCRRGPATVVTLSQRRYLPLGAAPDTTTPLWRVPVCLKLGIGPMTMENCVVLTAPQYPIEVPTAKCATWIWPNTTGLGYYRAGLTAAQWRELTARGWAMLSPVERLSAAGDLAAAIEAGEVGVDVGLALVPALLAMRTRPFVDLAAGMVTAVRPFVPEAGRPAFGRWVARTFGPTAAKVGIAGKAKDSVDIESIRADVVPLVADTGGDAALRKKAVAMARSWRTLPESVRTFVLFLAVRADPTVHDRLMAELRTETDRARRGDLARALGATTDRARLERALGLLLDETIDIRDTRDILQAALGHEDTQPIATAWAVANLDALIARVPAQTAAGLVGALAAGCDAAEAPAMRALAQAKLADKPGGARRIDQAFERLAQCAARRAAMEPAIAAWVATLS